MKIAIKRPRPNKAPGPDRISCSQISSVKLKLFSRSLAEHHITAVWEVITVRMVPQNSNPNIEKAYYPIVLTLLMMETLDKLNISILLRKMWLMMMQDYCISPLPYLQKPVADARMDFVDFPTD